MTTAGPAAAENVLRFTSHGGGANNTFDPHSWFWTQNRTATEQVYEALLDVDSNLNVVPQLALAWKPLNPTTWEFQLRPDVRFHDDTPLTVEDVVFSIERARAKTSDLADFVGRIAEVEAVDDATIRIATTAPDPVLWLKLSHVAIMSKAWAQQHGVATPADFKGAREETYASRHANGTGPFVLQDFTPGSDYQLIRNPEWWGLAEYQHNIDRIVHTWSGDAERDLRALIDGKIDLLQDPPYAAHDLIRRTRGLKLEITRRLLTFYFGLDQGSAELRSSNVKGKNPFADRRVRQAMYQALDLEAILSGLMGDLLIPAGMVIAPGINGYSPELDQRLPYDPEKARALLVEAGYPDGFGVTVDCMNDTGDDEIATCRGVAAQLGEVGIQVTINFLSADDLYDKAYVRRQSDFYLDTWELELDSQRLLRMLAHSGSLVNATGYANPRVDELIEKIETEIVTYARDAYLEEAWRIVTDDIVYLPVRHSVTVWAMRDRLEIPVDPWGIPRFRLARLKETPD